MCETALKNEWQPFLNDTADSTVSHSHILFFVAMFIRWNLYCVHFVVEFDMNTFLCKDELRTIFLRCMLPTA
jgi:hypothetical protein